MKIVITKQFVKFMEEIEISFSSILKESDIPNLLWKEELVLNEQQYYRLLNVIDGYISNKQILELSSINNVSMFMPSFFAALCASTGRQALNRFSTFKQIVGPINISVEDLDATVSVRLSFIYPQQKLPRFAILVEQLLILSLIRTGTGELVVPLYVSGPFTYGEQISQSMQCIPEKTLDNVLIFRKSDLEKNFLTENNSMWQILEPELKNQLLQIKEFKTFSDVVQNELIKKIPSREFSLNEISESLGISNRTLQRNLASESTTFNAQLQIAQKILTMNFIQNTNLTKTEITYLVGYTDLSSFSRAFKKWTGTTFSLYKKNLKSTFQLLD